VNSNDQHDEYVDQAAADVCATKTSGESVDLLAALQRSVTAAKEAAKEREAETPRPERPKFDAFKAEQLRDPEVRAAYAAAKARPERVTLTHEERADLSHAGGHDLGACDCVIPDEVCEVLADEFAAVERILAKRDAAREQALREEIARPLEQIATLLDKEVAENVEANVRYAVVDVRCWDCNLRHDERDQYGCGESGRGHNYDAQDIATAQASARAEASEYVTLSVADLRAALRGETR